MYKVVDFFCGGGGFSEGFKLAGFEIILAIDKWKPAVTTHNANHPKAVTKQDDVIRISNLPDEEFHELVPDSEVIIGSPPCTSFSNSNKSGKADKSLGVELIEAYLRIVARKHIKEGSALKHWVLENVPNVFDYIKDEYTYKELGIDKEGTFQVKYPSSKVYNAKYFNVASNRKRYFCGNFPEPKEIITDESEVKTISNVLSNIKNPDYYSNEEIKDPNFNFKMKNGEITDHHYIMEVSEFEWKKAKRQKQDKGYMGRMSFPENFDKPSRTVMATMSSSSRESMIYPYIPDENRYRLPTVREIACLMSYPLDYRFYGKSKSIKYKLVGNSVPPKMSFAIAKAIAEKNILEIPKEYSRSWLIKQKWISYEAKLPIIRKYFQNTYNIKPAIAPILITPNLHTILKAIEDGIGISVLPDYICQKALDEDKIVIVHKPEVPITNTLFFVYKNIKKESVLVRQFLEIFH